MGLAPSTNINPTGEYPSMFEPVHGSAFDIMGEGIANPIGTVLSWELLWEHLDEPEVAEELRGAVVEQLRDSSGPRTPDLGGDATTEQVASDLCDRIG